MLKANHTRGIAPEPVPEVSEQRKARKKKRVGAAPDHPWRGTSSTLKARQTNPNRVSRGERAMLHCNFTPVSEEEREAQIEVREAFLDVVRNKRRHSVDGDW
jgi:hypothetical protein